MNAILLVDDDEDCRMLTREAIEASEGGPPPDVLEAASGEEALDLLERLDAAGAAPRLIYLDVDMPGMGGLGALERIRSREGLRAVPIIMFTAMDDDGRKRLAASLGANSYAVKPRAPMEFDAAVRAATRYWLHVHRAPADAFVEGWKQAA